MSSSGKKAPDDWGSLDEAVMAAHSMFRKGKREESCRFLAQHEEQALSHGAPDEASTYASIRGSYLVAMGRDSDALEAYLEAERFSEGAAHSVLTTARHLLSGMKQPDKALARADEVLALEDISYAMRLQAHAVRGLAFLDLDQPEDASEVLELIFEGLEQLPAKFCNLMLVEGFLRRGFKLESCRRYLDLFESKATAEGSSRTLKEIARVRRFLP
jgi:tetratricopeptide (TPR) repeat protein